MDGVRVLAALFACLLAAPVTAQQGRDSQQEALDRLQEEQRKRFQRQLDESYLPGRKKLPDAPEPDEDGDKACFPIQRIQLGQPGEPAPALRKLVEPVLGKLEGQCLSLKEIKALQKRLGNRLIDRGYISSRVLMPEQSLKDQVLELKLVAGRMEGIRASGVDRATVQRALPMAAGDVVQLAALEQAIENLNRVQGLNASLDIKPGTKPGRSLVVAQAREQRRYSPSLTLDQQFYGDTDHGTANARLHLGHPFARTDRVILSVNTDLDTVKSDTAWGAGIDYDIGVGYWLFKLAFNRQVYRDEVAGAFRRFDTRGETDISRLKATRVLFRSGVTRLTTALLGRYSDAANLLNEEEIHVSTYRLRTGGVELDYTQRLGEWEVGTVLTWEKGTARGPAADLPGGGSVGNRQFERTQLYASVLRPFRWLNSSLQFRVNSQYSPDRLYPSDQFSLTAGVGGYEEIAFSGNSGASATLEVSTNHALHNTSLRPYLRAQSGLVPDFSNEPRKVRLSSATAGLAVHWSGMKVTLESAWPLSGSSTAEARNDYVARAGLQWSW